MKKEKEEEPISYIYEAKGVCYPEYWQCIWFIASYMKKKEWKSQDTS